MAVTNPNALVFGGKPSTGEATVLQPADYSDIIMKGTQQLMGIQKEKKAEADVKHQKFLELSNPKLPKAFFDKQLQSEIIPEYEALVKKNKDTFSKYGGYENIPLNVLRELEAENNIAFETWQAKTETANKWLTPYQTSLNLTSKNEYNDPQNIKRLEALKNKDITGFENELGVTQAEVDAMPFTKFLDTYGHKLTQMSEKIKPEKPLNLVEEVVKLGSPYEDVLVEKGDITTMSKDASMRKLTANAKAYASTPEGIKLKQQYPNLKENEFVDLLAKTRYNQLGTEFSKTEDESKKGSAGFGNDVDILNKDAYKSISTTRHGMEGAKTKQTTGRSTTFKRKSNTPFTIIIDASKLKAAEGDLGQVSGSVQVEMPDITPVHVPIATKDYPKFGIKKGDIIENLYYDKIPNKEKEWKNVIQGKALVSDPDQGEKYVPVEYIYEDNKGITNSAIGGDISNLIPKPIKVGEMKGNATQTTKTGNVR